MADVADVVVVGAGLAGVRTCAELRAAGFTGSLLVVGAEPDPPYDRPPLTKDPDEEVDLRTAMGLDVWALADEVRLGVRVLRAERAGNGPIADDPVWQLTCSDGSRVPAGTLVVATGADPVHPRDGDLPGVHVLHTRSDAAAFWPRVGLAAELVVVGGGWVGCEAAATAAARGARVRLFEAGPRLLAGRVPAEVAHRIAGWLAELGIGVHLDRPVRSISADGSALAVADERADLVLAALGVRPATGWLVGSGAGVADDGAVLVDPWGRSDVAGLFAVGDAGARWSDRAAAHRPGGHWTEALNAPRVVGPAVAAWTAGDRDPRSWRAPAGGPQPGRPARDLPELDPIPYVFSDIAGRRLLTLGDPNVGRTVWRESTSVPAAPAPDGRLRPAGSSSQAWTAFSLDAQDRLVGLCTVGRPKDLAAARRAMLADPHGTPVADPAALADPGAAPAAMFLGLG